MVALGNVGSCLAELGVWDRALANYEDALERSRKLDADHLVALNTLKIGRLILKREALSSAREYIERGLELAETMDYGESTENAREALARLEYLQANLEAGETYADEVIGSDDRAEVHFVPDAYATKGCIRLAQGDFEGALDAHERGCERAADIERPRGRIRNLCGLADVHLRADRPEMAHEQAAAAHEAATERSNPLLSIEATLALGRVQQVVPPDRAEETLRGALDDARELGGTVHECEALYELGRLHSDHGDAAGARHSLASALALAGETGATLFERRCEDALGQLPDVDS
jgi:tetratricopeptide (TPR) repeat protein